MARGWKLASLLTACAALLGLAFAPAARADDSQIKISEVYSDAAATKNDYVELQLASAGQQIPAGDIIRLYTANAQQTISFVFPASTIVSDSQRTVLLGWDTNPGADFQVANGLNPPAVGGAACLLHGDGGFVDCVAWGAFTGGALIPSAGAPFPSALNPGQSLTRNITRGCPTLLDAPDDTDSSAADFALAGLTPRNNATFPTESACPIPAVTTTTKKKCKKGYKLVKKHGKKKCRKKKK